MSKNKIDFKEASKKSKKIIFQIFNFTMVHVEAFLIVIFFFVIIFWGYLFYQYTYKIAKQDPEVSVTSVKIKEAQLKNIVEDIRKREEKRKLIYEENNIKNIFEKKNENLTKEESPAKNISVPRFR